MSAVATVRVVKDVPLPEMVLRMWNLIEEAWLSEGNADRHERATKACMDFTDEVASHLVYEAAGGKA